MREDKPLKILMLSWEFTPHVVGGLGKHVIELVPELIADGVEVHLVAPRFSGGAATEPLILPDGSPATNGSRVYRVEAGFNAGDFFTNCWHDNIQVESFCSQLIRREGGFDLIHEHDWLSAFSAIPLKHDYHLPLLATFHATEMGRNHGSLWSDMQRSIHTTEWWLAYEAWRIIACSAYMTWEVQHNLNAPADKIDLIPNGVDPRRFDALEGRDVTYLRNEVAAPGDKLVYYVGRMVPEKGLSVLVDAVPLVLRELPNVTFVLAGGGDYANELRAKAAALGVSDRIIFPGRIADEARDALFKVADCAVFPSLYEPFGIVALEAMAAGCPVVVSDVGGLQEVVTHNETGIKVYPNDAGSLAWGILHTLLHPEWARARAENASRVARAQYNWDRIAAMTIDVYRRVINEARSGPWAYSDRAGAQKV